MGGGENVSQLDTPTAQLVCPSCGVHIADAAYVCREVGSWIFLDCPACHRQSDVTFEPIWRRQA